MSLAQTILVFVVLAPGVVFGVLAFLWLLGWVPGERMVCRITGVTFAACIFGLAALLWQLVFGVGHLARGPLRNWCTGHCGVLRQLVCGA